MHYHSIVQGKFKSRPNRFIAMVEIDGRIEKVHVKNTGRCKELLVPDAKVYLEKSDNLERKTAYDLVAVMKGSRLINMDSQLPNVAAYEWLSSGKFVENIELVKREVTFGNSRFDLYFEYRNSNGEHKKAFMEVKGVTLEDNGIVRFPDAPTERGIKHIRELGECLKQGYEAFLLFVIQMKDVRFFEPDVKIHADFAEALKEAKKNGVKILARDCEVTPENMEIKDEVEVRI